MAMNSVITSNLRKSRENEEAYWERMVLELEKREGVKFKFPKIYKHLKKKPKWKVYCNDASCQDMKRKVQPKGAKSVKQLELDKACVARVVKDLRYQPTANHQQATRTNGTKNKSK
jgi:hypothetical protein